MNNPTDVRLTPAPADIEDRLDMAVIAGRLVDNFRASGYDDLAEAAAFNELSIALTGFDPLGVGDVSVMHKSTGELAARVRVHWSACVGLDDPAAA